MSGGSTLDMVEDFGVFVSTWALGGQLQLTFVA